MRRVSEAVSQAERRGAKRDRFKKRIFEMLFERRFLPNSPTLMNAGLDQGQLSACFVLPVEDHLGSIFESLKDAALIHHSGGGTGFSFSRLRPLGDVVHSTVGTAAGPLAFMRIYNEMTDAIRQGGRRRGANMGILRVDHPDIEAFIGMKHQLGEMKNFNLSVGVTHAFMRALEARKSYALYDPASGGEVGRLDAERVFRQISKMAWEGGDPGLVFLDRINRLHPTSEEIEATNPCGEQPLLPYESCNLGSLSLPKYRKGNTLNWALLAEDIEFSIRFLDNVIEVNTFPVKAIEKVTRRNRKVGLGVMGFADLLLEFGVRYDSVEAALWAQRIMAFVDQRAKAASTALAKERGAFHGFSRSMWSRLGYPPLRNMTVTTVAPTGTISTLAGVSSGIEPIFSAAVERHILEGQKFLEIPSVLSRKTKKNQSFTGVAEWDRHAREIFGAAWCTSGDVSVLGHLRIQTSFQRFCDAAVSKTINLPHEASVENVEEAYRLAFALGCKGITVYRDKSRAEQVLSHANDEAGVCINC